MNAAAGCAPPIPLSIVRLNRVTILLGVILGFALHAPFVITAVAAVVALAGFCFGCFLFYQFKLNRARLFGA